MKKALEVFVKSIAGGVAITLGATIYVAVQNKIVGAFLFSVGILAIFLLNLKLYTGAVGYFSSSQDLLNVLVILLGNVVGTAFFALLGQDTTAVVTNVLSLDVFTLFVKSILCGMLIFVACQAWRDGKYLIVPIAIAGFILSGAQHSIAFSCYVFGSRNLISAVPNAFVRVLVSYIVIIVGNAVGSLVLRFAKDFTVKSKQEE